ncbi:MAG: ABC transporter substrate-binding protein [Bdellovibrionales bacterium]|nr:ABC transporter substrate-binding protein [Bdellovibrionales bacterium]
MHRYRFLGVIYLLTTFLHAFNTASYAQETDIVFGMSTALSGPAKDLGINMRAGVLAGFERTNRDGGIHGRKLSLFSLDDGYEPSRTVPNMRKLIGENGVIGIIGNVGTPTAIAALPIAKESSTLFYAAYTGAGVLRQSPPDRVVINYRASYSQETAAMIDALVAIKKLPLESIAFFTQRDGYGDAGFAGGLKALKVHGLKDESQIVHLRYERNTLAIEDALSELLLASVEPKAIILVGAYAPCAEFIRQVQQEGLHPLFLNVSFVGSEALARDLGEMGEGVIITQVVPHYNSELPIADDFKADLKRLNIGVMPTFGAFEGYIASRILSKALLQSAKPLTRESVVDALTSLGDFDIGLGEKLSLTPEHHQASNSVWPTIIRSGSVTPFEWRELGVDK